jgi:hypothetical protein
MATAEGKVRTLVVFDPSGYPVGVEVDSDGYLRCTTADAAKGSGVLTTAEGKLRTMVGFDADGYPVALNVDADGQLKVSVNGLFERPMLRYDYQVSGDGAAATSGSWRTYPLNTEVTDTHNLGVLASNQLTLEAGDYECTLWGTFFDVQFGMLRLQDITNTIQLLKTNQIRVSTGDNTGGTAYIEGLISLAAQTLLEVQYRVDTTNATNGLGDSNITGINRWGSLLLYRRKEN